MSIKPKILAFAFFIFCFFTLTAKAQDLPDPTQESNTDPLGLYQTSFNYKNLAGEGVKIVALKSFGSFFAYYLPPGFASQPVKRTLLCVHGTNGTPYAAIQEELALAKKYKYALVGVQWQIGRRFMQPRELYGIIDQSLRYMGRYHGIDITRVAYTGFSRGSAVSYEVALIDKQSPHPHFKFIISNSGAGQTDLPTPFFKNVQAGKFGSAPFAGGHFFLYCGEKDENWGSKQCEYMRETVSILKKYGGEIAEFIDDPQGKHGGFRLNPAYHERAILKFLERTK